MLGLRGASVRKPQYAEPDDLGAPVAHESLNALRAKSAFGAPFRLQQDLSNEVNVAGHGSSSAARPLHAPAGRESAKLSRYAVNAADALCVMP